MNDTQHILTPELQQSICKYILAGGFPEVAAEAAGVPAKVFARWMRFGEAKRPVALYRDFVQSVRQAQAQVRLVAEHKALEQSPLQWLKSGPGKETARMPGWTSPVRPPQTPRRKKALSAEQMQSLISTLLTALLPYPEARQAAAQALAAGGWANNPDTPPQPDAPPFVPEQQAEPAPGPKSGEEAQEKETAPAGEANRPRDEFTQGTVRIECKQCAPASAAAASMANPESGKPAPAAAERDDMRPAAGLHPGCIETASKVQRTASEGQPAPRPQCPPDRTELSPWGLLDAGQEQARKSLFFGLCLGLAGRGAEGGREHTTGSPRRRGTFCCNANAPNCWRVLACSSEQGVESTLMTNPQCPPRRSSRMPRSSGETLMAKWLCACGWLVLFGGPLCAQPSRAAWWLAQDGVKPIADLVNTAEPGKPIRFGDRAGKFQVKSEDRALIITGDFPEANIWRFDLTTFDGQFDMRKLYVAKSANCAYPDPNSLWTRKLTEFLGDKELGLTSTGPWGIYGGKWLVPTARVSLDGTHIYTSWFDDPNHDDFKAGRVYASFALDITTAGTHTIRVSFDDFTHGTRWRQPRWKGDTKPPITYSKNDLRPHHIGSIAIGIDERVRTLEKIGLRPELRGKHPRLDYGANPAASKGGNLSVKDVEAMIVFVDPDRAKPWEYSVDAESMASDNDMDAGKRGTQAAREYDLHAGRLSPEAKKEWDAAFLKRFHQLYTFFVFQRNFHPTGYAQNHSSATVGAILSAGLVWDGPEAEKWLRWGVMTCRKRIELYGRDGGVEWMNEARDYGLNYFVGPLALIKHGTGVDLTKNEPFFENEWRYALHQSWMFPTTPDRKPPMLTLGREFRGKVNPNVPVPPSATAENTPANYHFTDVDQVYMRSDWSENAYRTRLWAGSVFGKQGSKTAKRYNWAHCAINQGSFVLSKGKHEIILEAGWMRDYRKTAASNNCILVNGTDQWGGGQVWHCRLEQDQIAPIVFFADGTLLGAARTDLKNAYPPEAKLKAISRCVLHIKPDVFLVFDRVETAGKGKAEWRYHAAYVEPMKPASRFTAYGYDARPPLGNSAKSYEEAFKKLPDVNCEVAFLTPDTAATVGMTDTYYRWSAFSQPQRHMKVVRESDGPMTLLTAFGPKFAVQTKQNVHTGSAGDTTWTVLTGPGSANGLESDAHLAIAVQNKKSGEVEVMRFGGKALSWQGTRVEATAEDVLATLRGGKVTRTVTTLP